MFHLNWPVLTADNCFQQIRGSGIVPWSQLGNSQTLEEYLQGGAENVRRAGRFAPRTFVAKYQSPKGDKTIHGFRTNFTPYAMVFGVIDGFVPVTAEWKHGYDRTTIVPVAGAPNENEMQQGYLPSAMLLAACREWQEETGTMLADCVPLGPVDGLWANVRTTSTQCFLFLATVQEPVVASSVHLDQSEELKMFRFPLAEWIKLMTTPALWDANPDFGLEAVVPTITFLALEKLGKLKLA